MPQYEITSPDGRKFRVTAPDGASKQEVLDYYKSQTQAPPQASYASPTEEQLRAAREHKFGPPERSPMAGVADLGAAVGAGAVMYPLSGLAGLAGNAVDLVKGESPQRGERWARGIQEATYQPKTLEGQYGATVLGAGPMALSQLGNLAGEKVSDLTNMPSLGAAVNTGISGFPVYAGPVANAIWPDKPAPPPPAPSEPIKGIPLESIRQPQNAARMETWKEANQAGYKFPPTQIEPSVTRGIVESIGGKAAVKQKFTIENQQRTNQLAREAAGLKSWQPITKEALRKARDIAAGPYRELKKLYIGADAELENLKNVRHEASRAWQMARSGNPEALKTALDLDKQAAQIETALEAFAKDHGNPGLVARLREARVKIAQNYQVDRATNFATGDVYANELGAIWEAQGGQGFTGPLLTIAKTSKAFPQFMGPASSVPTPGVNQLMAALSAHGIGEVSSGKLGTLADLALWPASGLARKAASSARLQAPLRSGQGLTLRQLSRIPPGAITPSLGLHVPETD